MRLDHLLSRELPGRCNGRPYVTNLTLRSREHSLIHSLSVLKGQSPFIRLVVMAEGNHTFPSRTRPLSPPAPMVLGPQGHGRVGRRQADPQGFCGFFVAWKRMLLTKLTINFVKSLVYASEAAFASQKLSVCFRSKLFVTQKFWAFSSAG